MMKILFVCHGNICRSTMSEFVFKDMVRKAGCAEDFYIESAATSREEIGHDTDPRTKRKLEQHGIPYTKRRARQITKNDYDKYDYIIAMDISLKINFIKFNILIQIQTVGQTDSVSGIGTDADGIRRGIADTDHS